MNDVMDGMRNLQLFMTERFDAHGVQFRELNRRFDVKDSQFQEMRASIQRWETRMAMMLSDL